MADRLHSRFEWADWRCRLEDFAGASATAEPGEQAFQLRDFHDLIANMPERMLLDGVTLPGRAVWEPLLACGAFETAALAFVGPRTGCMISRGAEGFNLASIALPGHGTDVSANGATIALAVLSALAGAIGALTLGGPIPAKKLTHGSRLLH